MKILIFPLLLVCFFSSCAQSKKTVGFNVSYSNKYCGGARPTPEVLEKEKEQFPFVNSTLRLIEVKRKKTYLLKLNEKGFGSTTIKPGEYMVYLGKKSAKQSQPCNFNPSCDESLKRSYGTTLVQNESELSIHLIFPCDPCDVLKGKKQ